jgi:putative alpha-1,2-mannosidase
MIKKKTTDNAEIIGDNGHNFQICNEISFVIDMPYYFHKTGKPLKSFDWIDHIPMRLHNTATADSNF